MKYFGVIIFLSCTLFGRSQGFTHYIETDTSFIGYVGIIRDKYVHLYLQFVNDSLIQGHYFYHTSGININLTGVLSGDSILLFEKGRTDHKIIFFRGEIEGDSIIGISSYKKSIKKVDVKLRKWAATGDLYAPNTEDKSVVFCSNDQSYSVPFSHYLDNRHNYTYVVLLSEMIDHHFYSIIRFFNYPDIQKAKTQYGLPDTEHFLLYAAFNENGEIELVQTIRIISRVENIICDSNVGNIINTFKDSLDIDIISVKEKTKTNLTLGRLGIGNGINIKKEKIYIPDYLFDNIELQLDRCYDLMIRYELTRVSGDEYYIYKVDSVYELNNLAITELDSFCNDLKKYGSIFDNGKITFGDYKDIVIDDYNFDKINDIYIYDNIGSGRCPGCSVQTIWVYNPKNKKYVKDMYLSRNLYEVQRLKRKLLKNQSEINHK